MTSSEARKITEQNTPTQEDIEKQCFNNIMSVIKTHANMGSDWVGVSTNLMYVSVENKLKELGYVVELNKGLTLMDKDRYKVSW